jgi:hypothetical protein
MALTVAAIQNKPRPGLPHVIPTPAGKSIQNVIPSAAKPNATACHFDRAKRAEKSLKTL